MKMSKKLPMVFFSKFDFATEVEIERAHHDGKRHGWRTRYILVKLSSYTDKVNILKSSRQTLQGESYRIVEDLTKVDLDEKLKWKEEVSELYREGQKLRFVGKLWRDLEGKAAPFYEQGGWTFISEVTTEGPLHAVTHWTIQFFLLDPVSITHINIDLNSSRWTRANIFNVMSLNQHWFRFKLITLKMLCCCSNWFKRIKNQSLQLFNCVDCEYKSDFLVKWYAWFKRHEQQLDKHAIYAFLIKICAAYISCAQMTCTCNKSIFLVPERQWWIFRENCWFEITIIQTDFAWNFLFVTKRKKKRTISKNNQKSMKQSCCSE